jgi:hypothetical protein
MWRLYVFFIYAALVAFASVGDNFDCSAACANASTSMVAAPSIYLAQGEVLDEPMQRPWPIASESGIRDLRRD